MSNSIDRTLAALAAATVVGAASPALGASFAEDFEVDPTAGWVVHTSPGTDSAADFFFDYSTVGIPAAPGGAGTRGVKLQATATTAWSSIGGPTSTARAR